MFDLNIFYPASLNVANIPGTPCSDDKLIKEIDKTTKNEFYGDFIKTIERRILPKVRIIEKDDNGINTNVPPYECTVLITLYRASVSVNLTIFDINWDITNVLNQVSSGNLCVEYQGKEQNIVDYLCGFGITVFSDAKCLITASKEEPTLMDKEENKDYKYYILAGEAFHSKQFNYRIKADDFRKSASVNVARYNFSDIYLSRKNVLFHIQEEVEESKDRFIYSVLMIFIMEIIVLQIAALKRINENIKNDFADEKLKDISAVKEINEDMNKYLSLWDINNFYYQMAQDLFALVLNAFKVDEIKAEYIHNSQVLQNIIGIRKAFSEEQETNRKTKINKITQRFFQIFALIGIISTLDKVMYTILPLIFKNISERSIGIVTVVGWMLSIIAFFTVYYFNYKRNKLTK